MLKSRTRFLTSVTSKIPMRFTRALLCTPLALAIWTSGANAVPILSTQTSSVLLQAGETINGSFDLTSLAGTPYFNLNNASLTFYFSDDVDQILTGSTSGNYNLSYQSIFGGYYVTKSYIRPIDEYYTDPLESVSVSTVSARNIGTTSGYTSNQTGSQRFTGSTTDGWVANPNAAGGYYYIVNYWYDQTTTHTTGYRGNLSLTLNLSTSDLAEANSTGDLLYFVKGLEGDLLFNSVRLYADISLLPPPVAESVPEPATITLLGLGMTGLAIFVRRRK